MTEFSTRKLWEKIIEWNWWHTNSNWQSFLQYNWKITLALALFFSFERLNICATSLTVPNAIWQIFYNTLFPKPLAKWNNRNLKNEGNICHIARDWRAITSLSLAQNEFSVAQWKWHFTFGNQSEYRCFYYLQVMAIYKWIF